jgi:signal transduction histidine kinase
MHPGNREITLVIIAGTMAILLLGAGLIVYVYYFLQRQNKHLKEKDNLQRKFDQALRESQIEVQESTMSTLAKELHDNVGQLLSSTKVLLGMTQRALVQVPETLNLAEETVGQAINEIRSLSKVLSNEWLEQFELLKNLENEVNRINTARNTAISFSSNKNIKLISKQQIVLFRIIQESLQNAIRHANANNIYINLTGSDERLFIEVKDDGNGFEKQEEATGLGLLNMKQRTESLGGTIKWISGKGEGCTVEIDIPTKT